ASDARGPVHERSLGPGAVPRLREGAALPAVRGRDRGPADTYPRLALRPRPPARDAPGAVRRIRARHAGRSRRLLPPTTGAPRHAGGARLAPGTAARVAARLRAG